MPTTVRFLGAAQEVTGSMHLVQTSAGSLLIDCGMYQGRREESRKRNSHLPPEAIAADAVILTHSHIDHSGSLPTLVKSGFRGRIYGTPATRDLCAYMLRDAARIQVSDAEYLNRTHGDEPGWRAIEPIYDENDALEVMRHFAVVPYDAPFAPLPGLSATLVEAGHILGSAQVHLDVPDGATTTRRLVFSGDLGRKDLPILRDPAPIDRADYLFMESTYGDRVHAPIQAMEDQLADVVNETVKRKGKVIVPAFAVGRTQEIVYSLHKLHVAGRIPDLPIFVDSPLAVNVTEVFKRHPECYDEETQKFVDDNGPVFTFSGLRYIEDKNDSIKLNSIKEPCIIVSASGMCESGRILHHLKNNCSDDRNTILVVGFMAQHTLGRRIVERRSKIKILGVERDLFARVVVMNGFSAHGDQHDLVEYASAAKGARRVFLVHGEPDQQGPLIELLKKQGLAVDNPKAGDAAALD
ncbi:MAG TPA: MBL fold metallo-hydrolase [Polyangia bacterium]